MDPLTLQELINALGRKAFARDAAHFDGLDLLVLGCCTTNVNLDSRHMALLQAVAGMRNGNRLHGADGLQRGEKNTNLEISQRVLLGDCGLSRAFVALVGVGSTAVLREFADTAVQVVEQEIVRLGAPHLHGSPVRASLRGALAASVTMLEGGLPVSITAARQLALQLEALCGAGYRRGSDVEAVLRVLEQKTQQPGGGVLCGALSELLAPLREWS